MQDKFLSVITINYNNAAGLQKTMESIISQTFTHFEYIVIDGGSADNSADIIRQFADKITGWVSEKDNGIYNAMNKGIKRATGEYILFVNSGDVLINHTVLEEVTPRLTGEEIIYGDYKVVSPGKTWIKAYPDVLSFDHFVHDSIAHSAAAFIKRSAFAGELARYDETLKLVSDWKWYLTGIYKYNYTYKHIPKIIGVFDFSGSTAGNPALGAKEKEQVLKTDFRNMYEEWVSLSRYKSKYETLQDSRFLKIFRKVKNLAGWK